jgi:hypothetical protein
LIGLLLLCAECDAIEGVHPMQGGILRRKYRTDRRPGMRAEPIWAFYPRYFGESVWKLVAIARQAWTLRRMRRAIENDPAARSYTDRALAPVTDDERDSLALFTHAEPTRPAVERAPLISAAVK